MIKKYCSDLIYLKGLNCYKEGYVLDIKVDKNNQFNSRRFIYIEGKIDSATYSEYLVKLMLDEEKSEIIDYTCSCDYFQSSKNKGKPCEHIVAAYLRYSNEYKEEVSTEIDNLMKAYGQMEEGSFIKQKLNLEIKMFNSLHDFIQNSIELKVGPSKTYVIKNIRDFLKSYSLKEAIDFGKNFILDFNSYDFEEEDKRLLDFLSDIVELTEVIIPEFSYSSNGIRRITSGKRLYIIDNELKKFMELIKHKSIELSLPLGDFSEVRLQDENINIEFLVYKTEEGIRLVHNEEDIPYPLTENGDVYFFKGYIYRIEEEKKKLYIPIINAMLKDNKLYIDIKEKDKMNFASFILPKLKKIGTVHIKEEVKEDFYEEDLKAEIYLDKEREGVALKLVFRYEDIELNPCLENIIEKQNRILIRDLNSEKHIVKTIEGLGFRRKEDLFLLEEEDLVVEFLIKGIDKLKELAEVYYSESFKNTKVYTSSNYKAMVRLNDQDMLEFSFSIDGVSDKELKNIFLALKEKKKYYKLEDGIVLLEESALKAVRDILDYADINEDYLEKEFIVLPKYNGPYIDSKLSKHMEYINKNKAFRELISSLKEIKDMDYEVPAILKEVLRPYQVVGFKWFKTLNSYGFGGILADEMGLGKTIQTISLLTSDNGSEADVIICPTSLVYNWKEELERFSPNLKVLIISGNKEEREGLMNSIENADVVITSYPLIRRDIEFYEKLKFRYCILDEAQHIKNPASQNALAVKKIKAKNRFALTGTPIENSLTELWSIFDFIMPGYLLTHNKFYSKYEAAIIKHNNMDALQELNDKVKPFILRRLKQQVIKELPPKIEHKITVDMTEDQKKLYSSYVKIVRKEIEDEIELNGINKSKLKILSALTRLRQICCDPSTFIEDYKGESGKLNSLYEILENCIEEGHKVLLFSQFTSVLKNISKELTNMNIKHMYLDGSVDSKLRIDMVKEFNKGDSNVFLISLKAGGTGLNLTSADVVIHFDPWWNPAVEQQATDRAHRIGQKSTVEVIKLITKGSIEEKIFNLQERKKKIINSVMEQEALGENLISSMTVEDIKELFS